MLLVLAFIWQIWAFENYKIWKQWYGRVISVWTSKLPCFTSIKPLFCFFLPVHALANKQFPGDPPRNKEDENLDYLKMIQSPIESPPDPLPLYQKRDNLLQWRRKKRWFTSMKKEKSGEHEKSGFYRFRAGAIRKRWEIWNVPFRKEVKCFDCLMKKGE